MNKIPSILPVAIALAAFGEMALASPSPGNPQASPSATATPVMSAPTPMATSGPLSVPATIHDASAVAYPANLPLNGSTKVTFKFSIAYPMGKNTTNLCGAKISYSDGHPEEKLLIDTPTGNTLGRAINVGKSGPVSATLSGFAFDGKPPCKGSAKAETVVGDTTDTLTKLQILPVSGGAPRPNANIIYAKEAVRIDVSGKDGIPCGYRVLAVNTASNTRAASKTFTSFGTEELFAPQEEGVYSISVKGEEVKRGVPACLGELSANLKVSNKNAWIVDFKLMGQGQLSAERMVAEWWIPSVTIQSGATCYYATTWTIGSKSMTFPGVYDQNPVYVPPRDYMGGGKYMFWKFQAHHDNYGEDNLMTLSPSAATVTIEGILPAPCNGKITKYVSVPLPNFASPKDSKGYHVGPVVEGH